MVSLAIFVPSFEPPTDIPTPTRQGRSSGRKIQLNEGLPHLQAVSEKRFVMFLHLGCGYARGDSVRAYSSFDYALFLQYTHTRVRFKKSDGDFLQDLNIRT
jgi:hypothetical protein